jgi:hypothetical protein
MTLSQPKHPTWAAVFKESNGYCAYCGVDLLRDFHTWYSSQRDHVIAQCVLTPEEQPMLVMSCGCCNSLLSRASHLRAVEERRAYVEPLRRRQEADFLKWKHDLRPERGPEVLEEALATAAAALPAEQTRSTSSVRDGVLSTEP